jgi:uncharacterized protein YqeY
VSDLKARLQTDLTGAIRARDELTTATLRMALAAVTIEEVAGSSARELSDDDVLKVLAREAKKRREAAEAFRAGDRTELADRERAEGEVVELVRAAIAETGATGMPQMGAVMKAAQARAAGRADGRRLSTEVRRQLG